MQGRVNAEDDKPSKLSVKKSMLLMICRDKNFGFSLRPRRVCTERAGTSELSERILQTALAVVIYRKDVKAMKRLPAGLPDRDSL